MTPGDHSERSSRYIALINALTEASHEMQRLDMPKQLRERFLGIIQECRAEAESIR